MVIADRPAKPMRNLDPFAWQVSHPDEPAVDIGAFVALIDDLRQRISAADLGLRSMLAESVPLASPVDRLSAGADREVATPRRSRESGAQERSTNASRSAACTSASSPSPSEK